jgi:hypothetical protein
VCGWTATGKPSACCEKSKALHYNGISYTYCSSWSLSNPVSNHNPNWCDHDGQCFAHQYCAGRRRNSQCATKKKRRTSM